MAVELLERGRFLATLDELLRRARAGNGQIALVSGDAGIGKTALVEGFVDRSAADARTLWGACEALFTPRPLGPLYDIARQVPDHLRQTLEREASRAELFAAVLDELARGPLPTLAVIEDIHWADEATLDLIKYLARRVQRMPVCLVLTYRDDELVRDHPLRLVLGDLPAREVTRLELPPLSAAAVAALATEAHRSPSHVFELTGGNPFFISALLAADTDGAPTSVADAVLGRMARLAPEAQGLLELVAVAPGRIALRAVTSIFPESDAALEACLNARLLALEDGMVGYRHELARQAVEGTLGRSRRRMLNAQLLRALLEREEQASLAQLVHHAAQAEDGALVLRYAPAAARQASARGALREAIAHYRTALIYVADLDGAAHAELLQAFAGDLFLAGGVEEAARLYERALALWRDRDQPERLGLCMVELSRVWRYLGRPAEAHRLNREAVILLESLPPGHALARAYSQLSGLSMVKSDCDQAVYWGSRALAIAEPLQDTRVIAAALCNMGACEWCEGDEVGHEHLERSLRVALENGHEEAAAFAYANLADTAINLRKYDLALGYIRDGLAHCAAFGLDPLTGCLRTNVARIRLDRGDWAGADEEVTAVLAVPWIRGTDRVDPLLVLGQLRARRGDPGAVTPLDEARALARASGEPQHLGPTAALRAEWRWLQGDVDGCRQEALEGFPPAINADLPRKWAAAAVWLWRGAGLEAVPANTPQPNALEIAGDWRAAAAAWEELGFPYERALALMAGDETAQRTALTIFEGLGATPAAAILRQRLRAAGARGLPRGPRAATQANPHGLTPRQLEVLILLAEGLRYGEIADRLSTTHKTIEHHVSAVLAKLGARSRAEAVHVATQLGLVAQAKGAPVTSHLGAS